MHEQITRSHVHSSFGQKLQSNSTAHFKAQFFFKPSPHALYNENQASLNPKHASFAPELKNSITTISEVFIESHFLLVHFSNFFEHSLPQVLRSVDQDLLCIWSEGDSRSNFASKVRNLNFRS